MDELGNLESISREHDVQGFKCGELALDNWLVRYALINQQSGSTKTFVLPTIPQCGRKVVAFYSLVAGSAVREDAIPAVMAGTPTNQAVPVVLLARLAVAKDYQGKGIGPAILKDALRKALDVSRVIGVRAVLVHAKHAKAVAFYKKTAGFEPSPTNPLHLMLPIQEIADAFK